MNKRTRKTATESSKLPGRPARGDLLAQVSAEGAVDLLEQAFDELEATLEQLRIAQVAMEQMGAELAAERAERARLELRVRELEDAALHNKTGSSLV